MGRTNNLAMRVAELHRRLHDAEKNKQSILARINSIKNSCLNHEISYAEYQSKLSELHTGKTLTEWVEYYDTYILLCKKHIEQAEKQYTKKKYANYSLILISAILVIFMFNLDITGFIISDENQSISSHTQEINSEFTEDSEFTWSQENPGQIYSVSFSGKLYGEGNAKIYFDENLILDLSSEQAENVSSFKGLTGFFVEGETNSQGSENSENSNSPASQQEASQSLESESPSHTSSQTQDNIPQDTNPQSSQETTQEVQEQTPASQQIHNVPENISQQPHSQQQPVEETPLESPSHTPSQAAETNISENNTLVEIEQNATQEIQKPNATTEVEESNDSVLEQKEFSFTLFCNSECNLTELNINSLQHQIRIELHGTNLTLKEIEYKIPSHLSNLENATIISEVITLESPIIVEETVQWKKEITLDQPGNITVDIPIESTSISASAVEKKENADISEIKENIQKETKEIEIKGESNKYEVLYETPAPTKTETNISENQKEVTISAPDELNYTQVISFTDLPKPMLPEQVNTIKLYWEVNGTNVEHAFTVNDTDADGLIDRLQWITPHLSNQTFIIIIITKAEHLDTNRSVISDIYDQVKEKDDIWSETINENEYVRVRFEIPLDNTKDITIFPRFVSGTPTVEVYEINKNELITTFNNINENQYNKVFLTNLNGTQQDFDLKIINGSIEFDHIIDPSANDSSNNIYQCGSVDIAGSYILNQSISGTATCLSISSNNVHINCQGNTIEYGSSGGNGAMGINVSNGNIIHSNISISNCIIIKSSAAGTTGYGIQLGRTTNSTLYNNTIQTNGTNDNYGIYLLNNATNNNITENIIQSQGTTTGNIGIYLATGSSNNTVYNNNVRTSGTTTGYGVYLLGTATNKISGNLIDSNNITTKGSAANNYGIYITTNVSENIISNNLVFTNGTTTNHGVYIAGIAGHPAKDNIVSNNTISVSGISSAVTNYGIYLQNWVINTSILSNNVTTTGTTANYGIYIFGANTMGSRNNIVSSNLIQTSGNTTNNYGIYLNTNVSYNTVTNNTIFTSIGSGTTGNAGIGISGTTTTSVENIVSNNRIFTNGTTTNYGIYLTTNASNNTVSNNIISTNGTTSNHGIYIAGTAGNPSDNNIVSNNTISAYGVAAAVTNYGIYLQNLISNTNVTNNNIITTGTTTNYGIYVAGTGALGSRYHNILNNEIQTRGSTTNNYGIYLSINVSYNEIINNTISTTGTTGGSGIVLSGSNVHSSHNEIYDNIISTNGTSGNNGVYLTTNTTFNIIENNTISTNGTAGGNNGIYLVGSMLANNSHNIITNNNINTSGGSTANHGIHFSTNVSYNTVTNNRIIAGGTSGNYGINIITNSSNNLFDSNNMTVIGTAAAVSNIGISMSTNANNNNITNNSIDVFGTTNSQGVVIIGTAALSTTNNIISNNNIFVNGSAAAAATDYGVYLTANVHSNKIFYNNITTVGSTQGYGVYIRGTSITTQVNNNSIHSNNVRTISNNGANNYGIYLVSNANDNNITKNNISTTGTSTNYGAYLLGTATNKISGNIIDSNNITTKGSAANNYGVYLNTNVSENIVSNNLISTNGTTTNHGVYIIGIAGHPARDNIVSNNTISVSGISSAVTNYGIYLQNLANNNNFTGNNIITTGTTTNYGIYILGTSAMGSENNIISNNYIQTFGNTTNNYGIYLLTNASYNEIINNTVRTNGTSGNYGIYISGTNKASDQNQILYNLILSSGINNNYGIYLDNSSSNNISLNTISTNGTDNSSDAIYIYRRSENNTFANNIISSAKGNGINLVITTGVNFPNQIKLIANELNDVAGRELIIGQGIDGTSIINQEIKTYNFTRNISSVQVENSLYGKILFLRNISGSGNNLSDEIKIANNSAYLNGSNIGLNVSANITLTGIKNDWTSPVILSNSNKICDETTSIQCFNFTDLNAGTVVFNVSSWSENFSIGERGDIDVAPPQVVAIVPSEDTSITYSSIDIEISSNVTDNVFISSVLANITLPNGTSNILILSNDSFSNKYNNSYTVPSISGRYNITIIANDTTNNINSTEKSWFNVEYIGLTSCANLTIANTNYALMNDVNAAETCFNITVNNIVFDGRGHSISGIDSGVQHGIFAINRTNLTIKNFRNISHFGDPYVGNGIFLLRTNNSIIYNVSVNYNGRNGIAIDHNSSSNNIYNITADSNVLLGIVIFGNYNNVSNVTGDSNGDSGVAIENGLNNHVNNIIAYNNLRGITLFGDSNRNIISNITAYDNSMFGIHLIQGGYNEITNVNLSFNNEGIYIGGGYNTASHITANNNTYNGIGLANYNQLSNSIASGNQMGLNLGFGGSHLIINNATYNYNNYGMSGTVINNISLSNINADNNVYGIQFDRISKSSFINISANNNTYSGIILGGSGSKNITLNNISTNHNILNGIEIWSGTNITLDNFNSNENGEIGIYLGTPKNTSFKNGIINGSGKEAIVIERVVESTSNNTFEDIIISNTNTGYNDILFATDSTNDTKFIDIPHIGNYSFTNNGGTVTVEKVGIGEIKFTRPINGSGTNFTKDIQISNNFAFANISSNIGLNRSANITLHGVPTSYTSPKIYIDENVECNITTDIKCYNFTDLNAGTVIFNVSGWNGSFSIGESAAGSTPQITSVFIVPDQSITENSVSYVLINFTAQDNDGYLNLDTTTTKINLTRTGETAIRQNSSCIRYEQSGNVANYSCTLDFWYFDSAGEWNISVFISDVSGLNATNISTNFTILQTTAFVVGPGAISFSEINRGQTNITSSNDPLILNNTGNKPITAGNVQINATNLEGETDNTRAIYAGNFSVGTQTGGSPPDECGATGATTMSYAVFTGLDGATLPRGNHSIDDGTAQEQLFLCIQHAGAELTSQAYSTAGDGAWTIKVLLVALSFRRRKKFKEDKLVKIIISLKKEKQNKANSLLQQLIKEVASKHKLSENQALQLIENSQEIQVPASIFSSELGALEAISLYLKDKKMLRFNEIAEMLQRNERTIWTSYNKAKEKKVEISEKVKDDLLIPLNSISQKEMTVFESLIMYLKQEKEMKYSEIAHILNREQRNIWTIYNRASKKNVVINVQTTEQNIEYTLELLKQEISSNPSNTKKQLWNMLTEQSSLKYKLELDVSTKDQLNVPISIFSSELGALEAISLYLKDKKMLRFNEIAEMLQRNERTIWTSYNKAKEKNIVLQEKQKDQVSIENLSSKNLTIFESLIKYLKQEKEMKYSEIAHILNREQRNIWTIYNRASKKTH